MFIDREHYLELLKQIDELSKENQILVHQNTIIARELQREKTINFQLIAKFHHIQVQMNSLNNKVINQNEANHFDLKGYMTKLDQQHKKLIEDKFNDLKHSSFQKYKLLEIKNRANRFENHQLSSFITKVTKIYNSAKGAQEEPSLKDLLKWIKSLKSTNHSKPMEETHSSLRPNNRNDVH